jgi:hypothetical protein
MAMAPRFEDLHQMSEEELIALYNRMHENVQIGLSFVREEIALRASERQTAIAVRLTWLIALLTVMNTGFVINSVVHAEWMSSCWRVDGDRQ